MSLASELASQGVRALHAKHGERIVLASRWIVELDGTAHVHQDDVAKAGSRPTAEELSKIAACRAAHDPNAGAAEKAEALAWRSLACDHKAMVYAALGDQSLLRSKAAALGLTVPPA